MTAQVIVQCDPLLDVEDRTTKPQDTEKSTTNPSLFFVSLWWFIPSHEVP